MGVTIGRVIAAFAIIVHQTQWIVWPKAFKEAVMPKFCYPKISSTFD